MPKILPQIKHVVVVMFENRSFDNVCGWLYRGPVGPPSGFIPARRRAQYGGLDSSLWNPRNASYFNGEPPDKLPIMDSTTSQTNPNIDPEETFDHVTQQLYGPAGYADPPRWPMLGFAVDYEYATSGNPVEIMEPFTPSKSALFPLWRGATPYLMRGSAQFLARLGQTAPSSMLARQTAM